MMSQINESMGGGEMLKTMRASYEHAGASMRLSRRLKGTSVTANCFHPGFVATRFGNDAGGLMSFSIRIGKRFALSPQEGAKTLVYLASSPDVAKATGEYFYECRPVKLSPNAQDDVAARRLWEESEKLSGI